MKSTILAGLPSLQRLCLSSFACAIVLASALFAHPMPAAAAVVTLPAQDETVDLPPPDTSFVTSPTETDAPAWLEPRGINIIDLVGLVPDSHLKGGVVSYETGTGVLIYQSGTRAGNTVTVNVSVIPRYYAFGNAQYSLFGCLSQHPAWDQWPSTSPATTLKIYDNGRDITTQAMSLSIISAGQVLPISNPGEYLRYHKPAVSSIASSATVSIPANNGCTVLVSGRHTNLTATFTATIPQQIIVTPLGSQTFNARSYIGTGASGIFGPLNRQMNKYGSRHDKFGMSVPAGADYMIANFGPTPVDPYASVGQPLNAGLGGSGSYRFEGNGLSVDHVNMMGLPLTGQWRDADQSGSSEFLPYMIAPRRFTTPEYFLPPGFDFDPCMTQGNCPDDLLAKLHAHTYPITLHYYRIDRIAGSTLERIGLQQVGPGWKGSTAAEGTLSPDEMEQLNRRLFLPTIARTTQTPPPQPAPPDDPTGCPCGWFDREGRMFDFVPRP